MWIRRKSDQKFESIDVEGVEYCRLRRDGESAGGATIVRMRKGTRYPAHHHPGWEQALVLTGRVTVGGEQLGPGEYWYTEPGEVHDAFAEEELTFFVITEKEIERV